MLQNELSLIYHQLEQQAPLKIVITTHHKPDGDAMGSSLALYAILEKLGHSVRVITPSDYAVFLHWLPGHEEVLIYEGHEDQASTLAHEADMIFCLDFNDLSRINEFGDVVRESKATKILIDHHREPKGFEDYRLWTIDTSSTAELIFDFIEAGGWLHLVDKHVANCLYTGMMTDTGSFRFNSAGASTHRKVAHLIDTGMDHALAHQRVYDHFSLKRSRLMGYVLYKKLQVFEEYKTALVTLSREELQEFDVQTGDTEGFVNFGLGIDGVVFSVLIIDRTKLVKMSFRSQGTFACNEFASEHFNGGGHLNASGGASEMSLEETTQKFLELLPVYKDKILAS